MRSGAAVIGISLRRLNMDFMFALRQPRHIRRMVPLARSDPLPFATMIAVVTGAGSGIGRAATKALLSDGWSVVAAGRREAPLRESLSDGDGMPVPTDVTDPASVAALFAATVERYGRVD